MGNSKLTVWLGPLIVVGIACLGWSVLPAVAVGAPTHPERPTLSHEGFYTAGVAADSQGDLYVSDTLNSAVKIYDPSGTFLTEFTTSANGRAANGLVVDATGNVYVNGFKSEVSKYIPSAFPPTASTTYSASTINGNGRIALSFTPNARGPEGVAINPVSGDLYVAEGAGGEVQEFTIPTENYKLKCEGDETAATLTPASTNGNIKSALEAAPVECKTVTIANGAPTTRKRITFTGTLGTKDVPSVEVVPAIASVYPAFEMFRGTPTSHVSVYQPDGTLVSNTIGSGIAGADYSSVGVGANQNVYVLDLAAQKAYVLNPAGTVVLAEVDGIGAPSGAFSGMVFPQLTVDQSNGHVYVSDIPGHGVVDEFDAAGNFVAEISHAPALEEAEPSGLAVDNGASSPNKGTFYVTSGSEAGSTHAVYAYGPLTYTFSLKVKKAGPGNALLTSSPAGISCGTTCEAEFEADATVTLVAVPDPGSQLTEWSGCDAAVGNECEVTMDKAREVSANFVSAPVIAGEGASQVTDTTAKLEAQINSKESATSYQFEYLTQVAYEANGESFVGPEPATKIPSSPASIGAGSSPVSVAQVITGLSSQTTYRFRVVATNAIDTSEGAGGSFSTQQAEQQSGSCLNGAFRLDTSSAKLPDCRAYEQASPVNKNNGNVQAFGFSSKASRDGDAISFESPAGLFGGTGSQEFPTYVAKREGKAWVTKGLLPEASLAQRARVLGWTPDFSEVFDSAELLGEGNALLMRSTTNQPNLEVAPYTTPIPEYSYVGASKDGSIVIFGAEDTSETNLALTPDAAPGKPNVYAWSRNEPQVIHLAGVLPDGTAPPGGSQAIGRGAYALDMHVVSDDGSIYFTDLTTGQLYLRENPTAPETTEEDSKGNCIPSQTLACTIHVSASQKTDGGGPGGSDAAGPQSATFLGATPDGAHAFFTSPEKLTNDATTGPEPQGPAIASANLDGTGPNLSFLPAFARGIDIDETTGFVYWADPGDGQLGEGKIGRAKLDGSQYDGELVIGANNPRDVAVIDEAGKEYVFWTNAEGEQAGEGTIGRAELDGSAVNQECIPQRREISPGVFETLASNPDGIDVDSSHIYWTNPVPSFPFVFGALARGPLDCDAASVQPAFIDGVAAGDVAVTATKIYYSRSNQFNGFIRQANIDGTEGAVVDVEVAGAVEAPSITTDGSYLYWTNPTTSEIGRSDLNQTPASQEPAFIVGAGHPQGIAVDASHLFWSANQSVIANAGNDLYRFDVSSKHLEDLAPDVGDLNGSEVLGLLGSSTDGSYAYFAANGVPDNLAQSTNDNGEEAESGNCHGDAKAASGLCNLYLARNGEVTFIAAMTGESNGAEQDSNDFSNWTASRIEFAKFASDRTARVSADGETLLFRSARQLTTHENLGPECVQASAVKLPGRCQELYLYRADQIGLLCVSCSRNHAAPVGPARLSSLRAPNIGAVAPVSWLSRNMSSSGERVFFETSDALVPADINGRAGCPPWGTGPQSANSSSCQDVYEWEAAGVGSCPLSAGAHGCIYLISSGESDEATFFADASEDGGDAFIFTYSKLVEQDEDALLDVYDVSEGGGLESQNQTKEAPCVDGEACKGQPSVPPSAQSPGSSYFTGPSSSPTRPNKHCPKSKRTVRQGGKTRCVAKKKKRGKKHDRRTKTNRGAGQ